MRNNSDSTSSSPGCRRRRGNIGSIPGRWRFDFAKPRYKVPVEIDGGIYNRGRHVRGSGFERDTEKRNAAVMAGWRVLHFTPRHVKSGLAVQAIECPMRKNGFDKWRVFMEPAPGLEPGTY